MDVGIVGAGIIGCAIADDLSRRGYRVEVFDARRVGGGATQATAGVLAPFIEAPSAGTLQKLAVESLGMYDGFVAKAQSASEWEIEYRRCGTFEVATSVEAEERLRAVADAARNAQLTAQWHALEPGARQTRGTAAGGLLIAEQGYVRVEQLLVALRRAAERRGTVFHEEQPILKTFTKRDHVVIETSTGALSCGVVVIAAGSWSDVVGPEQPGIRPVRGQLLRLRWKGEALPHVMWSQDCYVVPWLDRTVLVGATVEEVGFDDRNTAKGVGQLIDAVQRLLPDAAEATFIEARAGLRPASDSGLPVIRPSSNSTRVIYATGHFRNGVLLAPLTARLVRGMVGAVS
ncbi:MAG: glycine oxidase ThiO [Acidobacteriota bacterium]|nr:glycine oxidase ThiO [Acidobacteriota bacterium]MDQ3419610.1 glycine oxidase ThiO [Acidobacteriota bacterium]